MTTLKSLKKWLLRTLIFITVIAMLILSTILATVSTESGTKLAMNLVSRSLPGKLSVGHVRGKLSGKLALQHIQYSTASQHLDIDSVQLHWHPLSALHHGLTINQLKIGSVTLSERHQADNAITVQGPTQKTAEPHKLYWPGTLNIKNVHIGTFTLKRLKQAPIQFKQTDVNITINQEHIEVNTHTALTQPSTMHVSLQASGTLKHLTADLTLKNTFTHWHGTATGDLSTLSITTQDATLLDGKLDLNGTLHLSNQPSFNAGIHAQHINLHKLSPNIHGSLDASIQIDGSHQHVFVPKLQVLLKANHAEISLNGAIFDQININWALKAIPLQHWLAPLEGSLSATGQLTGTYDKPQLQADISAKKLSWQKLSSPMIRAKLNANYHPKGTSELSLTLQKGTITYPVDLTTHHLDYQGGTILGRLDHQGLRLNTSLQFIRNSQLRGKISLPNVHSLKHIQPDTPITGQLVWHLSDISFIQALIPKVDSFDGILKSKLTIDGTLGSPRFNGIARLENGRFTVGDIQASARQFNLDAKASGHKLEFTGQTKLGTGSLNVEGVSDFSNLEPATHLIVRGNNAQLINTAATKITASPDVTIDLTAEGLVVKGQIDIPKGRIQTYEFGETESLPDDVVIIDPRQGVQDDNGFDISSVVELNLGDDILINMDGFKGRVTGKLSIRDEPNKPTTAAGQLQIIDGTFERYGLKFTIDQGKLSYHGGPISNPGLNIRAIRKIKVTTSGTNQLGQEDLVVGVNISGTANNQKFTLFSSNGSYSQGDILSYLFTGQPLGDLQGDGDNTKRILQAAAFGSNNLRNEIKNKLGLTDLDIETSTEIDKRANRTIQHTALVLGKYLSPKLYIRYSFDVMDHTNKLNIKYFLNKNWAIQTESSNNSNSSNLDNGVDVLYTIERN